MKKGKKSKEELYFPLHIHGIFDTKKKEIIKVSLDKDEIEMELALFGEEADMQACEFDIVLIL